MVATVLLLIGAALFAVRFTSVQTYLAQKLAKHFSKELHTTVRIQSLDIRPFRSVDLKGFLVLDQENDTLLYTPRLNVLLSYFSILENRADISLARLDRGEIYLKQLKKGGTNLDFIIDYFKSDKPKQPQPEPGEPYKLVIARIELNKIRLRYKNFRSGASGQKEVINFNDVELRDLSTAILGLRTKEHLAEARIEKLTFREKSGFILQELSAETTLDTGYLEFDKLMFRTPTTRLSNYLRLEFGSFDDFSRFTERVRINSRLRNSVLDPRDLNYFVPGTRSVDLRVAVDGDISGTVGNIKAKNFSVRAGQATYMKGDFDIVGLPDIDETFLELQFDQVYSNKADAERIIRSITGKKQLLPAMIGKLGNIYFKGRFTGFPKDFIADGEFKTSLGRVVSDVNMKLAGTPVYTGTIRAFDFDIGRLLGNKELGRTTFAANIKGKNFEYADLNERLDGKVSYIWFKNYRYTNIDVDGIFNRKLFQGKVVVDDRNLDLNFNGSIDLNPALPVFNFVANIRTANLHKLNFAKDTLQVDANFVAQFSGNDLDNIQGNVFVDKIRLNNPKNSITVDSISLVANGVGQSRSLTIRSDILDAGIKGDYDLATLPAYFIATARQYVPSLTLSHRRPENQDFELSLRIKYFEPLSLLFAPDIKIPDGANFNGKFVSAENLVSFSGGAKSVEYKTIKIANLIVDESSMSNSLNIVVTSDRVNFNDSLYVKNINISNILRNDSLSLNVKLSDKNATNQLDMNGLVEFGKDTTATFSLLPSDVIINRESWKVQEKVRIGFEKGRATISGFELMRDNQVLALDGVISGKPGDELIAKFSNFKLATFNPLAIGLGMKLGGVLNGQASMISVLKNPAVEADLKMDSLAINNTIVGDMQFNAAFDNRTRLVETSIRIDKNGKETLRMNGTYDAKAEQNSLNMDVRMDHSELIIFEPFVKGLVSSLKGTVSSDLKLTGTLKKPLINGSLGFNDAGMTVDYLKTPYRITDQVTVKNSVINLDNLVLRDPRNNQARARGTVDLSDPSKPVINVTLDARNFLALNTTSKDNPLYYGTAYGTGQFTFKGPVDDMFISIRAQTEEGTVFNIPLNAASTVAKNDFITFVAKDTTITPPRQTNQFKGVTMSFDLTVDDKSEVNIFTDIGTLSGRGNSDNLSLTISSAGDFIMTGSYEITGGRFIFTPRDFINKVFEITNGGTIRWAGDPRQALINLQAAYRRRANIAPLYTAAGRSLESNVILVEAAISLSGNLLKPTIDFDLNFPADAAVRDDLQLYLSDVNNVYTQAISFVASGQFTGGAVLSQNTIRQTGTTAATEIFFNQFNNFLAESLGAGVVDLNIRSFNEATATFRLFKDRLILTGGVNGRNISNSFEIASKRLDTDVEAQYLIRPDGTLALRASNRRNNRNLLTLDNVSYVSALGLVYRQDFDNFAELMQIISGKRKREERRKRQQQPATVPPPVPVSPPATALKQSSK